jgi:hypothetical protein
MKPLTKSPLLQVLVVSGLGVAVLSGGCSIPLGGTGVSSQSQTESLKESLSSLKDTVKALGQTADSGLKTVSAFNSANSYRLLGTTTRGDYTLTWGEDRQISRMVGPDTDLSFAFSGRGQARRQATISLAKLPDGTTGSVTLEVAAPSWNKPLSMGGEPYEFAFNQQPDGDIDEASLRLALKPQGKASEALDVTVGAKNFQAFEFPRVEVFDETEAYRILATHVPQIPTEIFWKGTLPRMTFDQKVTIQKGGSDLITVTWSGPMSLETPKYGRQDWLVHVSAQGGVDKPLPDVVTVSLTNTTQKFTFDGKLLPIDKQHFSFNGQFVSTLDKRQLASVSFDSREGDKAPRITYADGSSELLGL